MKKSNFFKKVCMALLAITLVATSIDTSGMNVQAATKKVTLSTTKQTINAGKTFKLSVKSVTGLKSKKVVFSTSNAKVATVSTSKAATSCTIKGISKGKVTITAKSTVSSKVIAKCTVTVNQLVTSISLNQTAYALAYGKNVTLKATALPSNANNKGVTWKSSNTKVATVNASGKVTATKKAGTAKITATAKDGSKKNASCTITVKDKKKITAVKTITMTPASATINVGASTKLAASVAPSKATMKTLFWTSSNPSIATVDQKGNVKAVKAGSVTITATAQDGSKKKATCAVTVVVPVAGISLNSSSLALVEGNSAALTATIAPADATDKTVTWSTSNANVATVANGTVTAVAAGTATITATASNGMAVSCTVTVTAKEVPPTIILATGVTLSSVDATITANEVRANHTFTLAATVAPTNATNKTVTWSSSSNVITVNNGVVTIPTNTAPKTTATITATTANGISASVNVFVTGEVNALTETANDYVFTIDKAASEYTLVKDSDSKGISTTDANNLINIYRNLVTNKLASSKTQAEKLESVWSAITKENIEENQSIVTATVADSTVGANRIKMVTLSAYGKTRTMTLVAPLTFSADATKNEVAVIEGSVAEKANTRSITLKNIAITADDVNKNNTVTFTVDAQKADGTVTAGKDFKAVIANDTKSATLYRVIAGVDTNVASYVESDTAYTTTIQKAFYNDVVSALGMDINTITDTIIYNVYE